MQKIGTISVLESHSEPKGPQPNKRNNANSAPSASSGASQEEMVVILFHGYGADAYDLRSLSEVLELNAPTRWIFPQGILEVPIGPGWTGRAWWNIDMNALQASIDKGEPRDLSNENPKGLEELRKRVMSMIQALKTPWNRIVLGGFSQGAMLATDIFLHAPESPCGLILWSGSLVNKANLKPLLAQRAGTRFFQSHGDEDAILQIRGAQQLESFLNSGGIKGRLIKFHGGHEIPMEVIKGTNEYLATLVHL